MHKYKKIQTKDGYDTLIEPIYNQHYHSIHGAYNEAMHVFIEKGLNYYKNKLESNYNNTRKITILEMGFGTGLNTVLTAINAGQCQIRYITLETNPIPDDLVKKLNYPSQLEIDPKMLLSCHLAEWEKPVEVFPNFVLHKINKSIEEFDPKEELGDKLDSKLDVVYFDAFSPQAQPEVWSEAIFEQLAESMVEEGVLVTYCAKSSVRRTLQACGFEVTHLPGPPGKREMIRAIKKA